MKDRPPIVRLRRAAHEVVKARATASGATYLEALDSIVMGQAVVDQSSNEPVGAILVNPPPKKVSSPSALQPVGPTRKGIGPKYVEALVAWCVKRNRYPHDHPNWGAVMKLLRPEEYSAIYALSKKGRDEKDYEEWG